MTPWTRKMKDIYDEEVNAALDMEPPHLNELDSEQEARARRMGHDVGVEILRQGRNNGTQNRLTHLTE